MTFSQTTKSSVTMRTIWKFKVVPTPYLRILELPVGAKLLHVGTQENTGCLWFEVDTEASKEERFFAVHGTGHEISDDPSSRKEYVGTYLTYNGAFVWHVYEVLSTED